MPNSKQLSVFLENKPGRLANVLSALARDKVNLNALTVMASHETGVLRFITDNLTGRWLMFVRHWPATISMWNMPILDREGATASRSESSKCPTPKRRRRCWPALPIILPAAAWVAGPFTPAIPKGLVSKEKGGSWSPS